MTKLARIARMSPGQLADRLRQEELKVLERLRLLSYGQLDPLALCRNLKRSPLADSARLRAGRGDIEGAAQLLLQNFRGSVVRRFFAGAVDVRTPELITTLMPDARALILGAAAKSSAGRFDLLGYADLEFGEPVDWHLDPLSGKKARLAHWSQIDPLDREQVGDHKVVWELNRQQWLLQWAQAYAFTRDESYAERCIDTIERWLRANPPGQGVNWASSLELAFRLIAWSWTLVLLRDSSALTPLVFVRILGAIHAHAVHIARYLSTTFSPNTHLLGEALGLFYAGVLFAESDQAASWRVLARNILTDEITRQVRPDGVYFEQSTCYQRYTIEMYMHFLILAARNGIDVPIRVAERVETCLDFLLAISRAEGRMPQIGDGDGGWLLPLVPRDADDMRGVFATGAALFGRADCAQAAGGPTAEVAWLLGPKALERLPPAPAAASNAPPPLASRLFRDGGYAVLRSDFGPRAHQMIVDVGPLGCPNSGAHGHADLLAVTCDVFGEPCIVDPGMPSYGGDPRWRDAFRSTALHSSVVVDHVSQALPNGPFAWQQRPSARLRAWISNPNFDFIHGEHDAYRSRRGAVTHQRRVLFVKPRYFVVIDQLDATSGDVEHHIELCFQFAPRVVVSAEARWLRAVTPGGRALLVRTIADVPLESAIHEGEQPPLPIRGWFSPVYGQLQPAPALTFSATTRLPLRVVTFLVPLASGAASLPEVFPPVEDQPLLQRFSV